MINLRFVATVPRGFSDLLAAEVTALGGQNVRDQVGGVQFEGSLRTGYNVLLESRLASQAWGATNRCMPSTSSPN